MQTGTFSIAQTEVEETPQGQFTYTYRKTIIIDKSKSGKYYQTERRTRNGVVTSSHNYPAQTDYAKQRRADVVDF